MFKNIIDKIKSYDIFLLISILYFSVVFAFFIRSVPYLDGNIDFVQSYDFYQGGVMQYFQNLYSVHPPVKLILVYFSFIFWGVSSISYNIVGYLLGIMGIISLFLFVKIIFSKQTARIACFLLATSPMFIAIGIFSLRDYILSVLLIMMLLFYLRKKYLFYAMFASFAVLTKETAILMPLSLLLIEILYIFTKKQYDKITAYVCLILPFFTYYLWTLFLKMNGKTVWKDWIFAPTADQGTIYTMFNNLLTFNFLNEYAYQHWLQLFILNFNWIFWIITITGFILFIIKSKNRIYIYESIKKGESEIKIILTIILFCFSYSVTVLTFQTYTIPRYIFPVIIFLLIGTAFSVNYLMETKILNKYVAFFALSLLIVLSSFYSIDPVSLELWGQTSIYGEKIYALKDNLAGNDGITYNLQYLNIVRKRTGEILSVKEYANKSVLSKECHWVFPDPNNDNKTIKILQLDIDMRKPCINI